MAALAVPGVARADGVTIGDGAPLKATLDGLGGLQVTYLTADTQPTQLYPSGANGFALRSGDTVSFAGGADRKGVSAQGDGNAATITYDVTDLNLHVVETDQLDDDSHELTRTFQVTNTGDTAIPLQAAELADTTIGGDDEGRSVMTPGKPRLEGTISPSTGQLSGLVEVTPWNHFEAGYFGDVFSDFGSGGLKDAVQPQVTDAGVGAGWSTTLDPQATWPITVVWRFDAALRVTSDQDHADDGSCDLADCTLREAINHAPDGGIVSVPAGTYELDPNRGELAVGQRTLTVYGAGANVGGGTVVDGGNRTRVLEVGDGGDVTFSGFSLRAGNGTIGGDTSPAGGSGGALFVQDGGALTVADSEVAGNSAELHGGGITSAGTLTLLRSTVADNAAGSERTSAQGAGLYLPGPGTTTVLDSTIGENTVYGTGGGIAFAAPLEILASTVADNHIAGTPGPTDASGVFRGDGGEVRARNSILAGAGPVCGGVPGPSDTDYDLVSDKSCGLQGAHDLQGADPQLGDLTLVQPFTFDVVIPQTRVFAPERGSPAVDAGDAASCRDARLAGIDQLGIPRIAGTACNIGSVEYTVLPAPVIVSPTDGSTVHGNVITFRGTAAPGTQVYVFSEDADQFPDPVRADDQGNWTLSFPRLDNGSYTFEAFGVDPESDQESLPSQPVTVTVDATAPSTPEIDAPGSAPVSGSTVTLNGTADPGDSITILEGGAPVGSATAGNDGRWTAVIPDVAPGTHQYVAVARNAAGAASQPSPPQTVTVASVPAATPTPTVTPAPTPTPTVTPLPPPVEGKAVNAQTKSGTIKIKLPGTNQFVELGPGQQIPVGTTVDTTHGRITLTAAGGTPGQTQQADFYAGIFTVTQSKGRKPVTQLSLSGPKPTCTARGRKAHASAARKGKRKVKTRSLWGSGHGAFRTKGQYSSATVRGTTWLTQDSCAGTLTRVTSGVVQVQDFVRHRKVLVRAGHRYLARAKRH